MNGPANNGIDITVSEEDFKSKPPEEQRWMLFEADDSVSKRVNGIQEEGCMWGQDNRLSIDRKILLWSSLMGLVGGAGVMLVKIKFWG